MDAVGRGDDPFVGNESTAAHHGAVAVQNERVPWELTEDGLIAVALEHWS